jgi:hypothetical protein
MIKEGFDFKKKSHYDLILLSYDNAGFHIRMGKRCKEGYDQYTKLIWITVTANDLIELGAYPNPSKTSGAQQLLPRNDGKQWLEEWKKDDISFDVILKPDKDDYEQLTWLSYSFVHSLLEAEKVGNLPSDEDTKQHLEAFGNFQFKEPLPDNFSSQVVDADEQPTMVPIDDASVTPYQVNNAEIDVPMQKDLNKKETVQQLIDYCIEMKKKILGLEECADDVFKNMDDAIKPKPIMEDICPSLAGDGLPSHMMKSLLKELSDTAKEVQACFGSFHMKLVGCKSHGVFFEMYLKDIFGCGEIQKG